jgi:hypothetical protein
MQRLAPTCLAFIVCSAHAATFEDRLAQADAACASSGGVAYLQSVYKHVGEVSNSMLVRCFESTPSADNSGFVVVANVGSTGKLSSSVARPNTSVASGFIRAMGAEIFEHPPAGKYQHNFPIVLNMDAASLPPTLECLRQE